MFLAKSPEGLAMPSPGAYRPRRARTEVRGRGTRVPAFLQMLDRGRVLAWDAIAGGIESYRCSDAPAAILPDKFVLL